MSRPLVVVVDDDRLIRDVLTELLESEGFAVEVIGDGPSAYERIRKIRDKKGPIAAITLDLSLPGKSGASILRELKADPATRPVPVIVVSASLRLLCPETRPLAAAIIRKPFDLTNVLDTVSRLTSCRVTPVQYSTSTAIAS